MLLISHAFALTVIGFHGDRARQIVRILGAWNFSMSLIEQLTRKFGDAVQISAPESDATIDNRAPQVLAAPRDEDAAVQLLRWCGAQNIAFVPSGARTRLNLGAPPERYDLLLSSAHLTQIHDHDEGNATVEASSGLALEALDKSTRQRGQFVPLSANNERATLGGAIALDQMGSWALKYGTARDLVTGVRIILSDGRVVTGGGKVVKNVSGYDLPKLFIGSRGTLGFITRVTLRLRPVSPCTRDYEWENDAPNIAALHAQVTNGAFDIVGARARFDGENWHWQARFEGSEKAVAGQIAQLPAASTCSAPASTCDLFSTFDQCPIQLRAMLPRAVAFDWARECAQNGANVIEVNATGLVRLGFRETTQSAIEQLRQSAQNAHGWLVVERAPVEWKSANFVWGHSGGAANLTRALKAKWDAAQVCAPGR